MRRLERLLYSGLIFGGYLFSLNGCKPQDSGAPISLIPPEDEKKTPPPTLTVPSAKIESQRQDKSILSEATVNGFTVRVIDQRKNPLPLAEYPDAPKIATALARETPNPQKKMAQRMAELRKWMEGGQAQWMETCRQEKEDEILTIALVDIITDEMGGKFGATVACPNRIDINPKVAAREGFDRVQSHELAHLWQILLNGWGQTTEEETKQNAYRFRGLTTISSCLVHQSRYGETVEQIIAAYGGRYKVEEMFYREKPNSAAPTTRLGEGWQITLCPK